MTASFKFPVFSFLSRFQIVQGPLQFLPHKCAICGRDGNMKFLDWNLEIEYFGKVVFCEDCIREAGNQFGWLTPDQIVQVKAYIQAQHLVIEKLQLQNQELKNALDSINSLRDLAPDIDGPGDLVIEESYEEPKLPEPIPEISDRSESGTDDPDDEQGSTSLSDDEDDGTDDDDTDLDI